MDNPEPQFNQESEREISQLNDRYDSLEYLVNSILVLLTFLAVVLAFSVQRLQSDKGYELGTYGVQATNFITQFRRGPEPGRKEFTRKLADYGRAHPDFLPVLAKYVNYLPELAQYGLSPSTTTGAPPATAIPPATTPTTPRK